MLEFEFDLSSEDYAAYNLYVLNHLPAGVRQLRTFRTSSSILVALASFALIAFALGDLVGGLIAGVLAGALMWLLSPWSWKRQITSNVRRLSRNDSLGTPGHHRLVVDDTSIREEGPNRMTISTWDKLQRVDETPEHVFLFTGPVEAFLIPRTADSDQVARLLNELHQRRPDLVSVST